ncbi:Histone-lysine N-methyltransferase SETMAR [Eumeta japonica]|uniref:Histone-lysine N-methyltransferase SETMAR n=1 Tax=Eumeta variegata TaxID=151549 RepID=A0A4C1VVA2_EUMVA|nr:Histone-lysine N-methyltransferase SETMAR [Eumeta japonica]
MNMEIVESKENSNLFSLNSRNSVKADSAKCEFNGNTNDYGLEKGPPDGGIRAYLIMVGSFLTNGLLFGVINSYSVIYRVLQEQLSEKGVDNSASRACVENLTVVYPLSSPPPDWLVDSYSAVLLQHDNARTHAGKVTRDKSKELSVIELSPHPEFRPDLALSGYYLFKFVCGKNFRSKGNVENAVRQFFASELKERFLPRSQRAG